MLRCPLLMLWTAPAPGHRNAVDCLSQAERFKEVRQATTVAFEVEGIGEDRRGNADKVDPGIGTTRVGQRIFECVLLIGTRSAQSIMASGFTAAQTGRTHDRTRPMLQQLRKFLPRRRQWYGPRPPRPGRISDVDRSEGGSSCRSFELAWTWQSTCLRFMALTDSGMLSFAKPYV